MPVVVKGLAETRLALRKFAPDLLKESDNEVRRILKSIVVDARGFVPKDSPMSGWATSEHGRKITANTSKFGSDSRWALRRFNQVTIRSGITSRIGRKRLGHSGFTAVYSIQNKSAAGAIYETAGRKSGGQGQGVQFIKNINKHSGYRQPHGKKDGRLAFRAVEENNGKAINAVIESVAKATRLFNSRTMFGGGA